MAKKVVIVSVFCFVLSQLSLENNDLTVFAQEPLSQSTTEAQVTISASIGEPVLQLWGYGVPNSRIELSGNRVSDFTYSKPNGYFEFPKAYLPRPTDLLYPELCITAIDPIGRATMPTCIPPLPTTQLKYNVGPVILPPTLSLEAGSISPSSQSGAGGITIPNSEVKIVLAEDKGNPITSFSLVKPALAYYIPNYTIKSDSAGYFSFNMPDSKPNTWRVFAITTYSQGASSPKSNTLKLEILSPLAITIKSIWTLILSLLTLPWLIALELLIVLLILVILFLSKKGKRKVPPYTSNSINGYQVSMK